MTLNRLLRVVVLAAIWVALWGEVSAANVVWGLVVAVVVILGFPSLDGENGNGIRPVAAVVLVARFVVMLVRSTWSVVVAVLRPKLALEQAIVAVPLRTDDPVIVTMVANGISLTPGTLTVDLGPDPVPGEGRVLYVHALALSSQEEVVAGAHELEDLALAAFPPPTSATERPSVPGPSAPAAEGTGSPTGEGERP